MSTKDGQYFRIKMKKEHTNIRKMRPPAFYLWAKDIEELKSKLEKKNITDNHIESIVEKGSDWDAIV